MDLGGQGARAVDQAVVHTPGVDADGRQGADVADRGEQSLAHLVPQVEHVPEQALALAGWAAEWSPLAKRRVWVRAMRPSAYGADHDAPGGGAEVDGADADGGGGHEGSFRTTTSGEGGSGPRPSLGREAENRPSQAPQPAAAPPTRSARTRSR